VRYAPKGSKRKKKNVNVASRNAEKSEVQRGCRHFRIRESKTPYNFLHERKIIRKAIDYGPRAASVELAEAAFLLQ
jgi:hypothetical protein